MRSTFAMALLTLTAVVGCSGSGTKKNPPVDMAAMDLSVVDMPAVANDMVPLGDAAPGGDLAAVTADTACTDDATNYCDRLSRCNPRGFSAKYDNNCVPRRKQLCLNALGAPGTASTPSSVEACAQTYPSFACAALANGGTPAPCLPRAGSLTNGTPCNFSSQCASTFCAIGTSPCGSCQPITNPGDACANGACSTGLYCSKITSTCVAHVLLGHPCENEVACAYQLTCVGDSAQNGVLGVCMQNVTAPGAPCLVPNPSPSPGPSQADCDSSVGLFCSGSKANNKVCVPTTFVYPTPSPSPSCGAMAGPSYTICAGGAQCLITKPKLQTGYCAGPAQDGEACATGGDIDCVAPAKCIGVQVDGGINGTCTFPGGAPYCQ